MANVSVKTVRRVFDQQEGVDRRTLQDLYSALGLALHPGDFLGVRQVDRTRSSRRPTLPVPGTAFLGRDADIEQAKNLLEGARLLTLTGPGGIGKTRLAVKIAGDLLPRFPENVWFIDLSTQSQTGLIEETILSAMGLPGAPDLDPRKLIADLLARRPALLVLDNCEHVVAQTAEFVGELLTEVPDIRIIVTTRQSLGLGGELELHVRAFPVPSNEVSSVEALMQYDVVRLFVDRATMVNASFRLTPENARYVAEICRRLEGIPFAVELAAARIKMLTPQDLLQRLGDRFGILGSIHRLKARHRTLRESLEWSYGLLSSAEQMLCNRLSLFIGGWTLEAAVAIAGDGRQDEQLVDLLGQLVNKSLVLVDFFEASQRYRFLETTREFAFDMLSASADLPLCQKRYAAYYADLAGTVRASYESMPTAEWVALLAPEQDNIRNVLELSLLNRGDVALGCRLTRLLIPFWLESGQWREGARWLTLARDRCGIAEPAAALAYGLGLLQSYGHVGLEAFAHIQESVGDWSRRGEIQESASALHTLGLLQLMMSHQVDVAVENLEQAVCLHRSLGNRRGVGAGLLTLALHFSSSESDERRTHALMLFAESLDYIHEPDEAARLWGSDREGRGALGTIGWDVENCLVVDRQVLSVLGTYPAFGIRQGVRVAALELASGMRRSARARCLDALERALGTGSIDALCDILLDVARVLAEAGFDWAREETEIATAAIRAGVTPRAALSAVVDLIQADAQTR